MGGDKKDKKKKEEKVIEEVEEKKEKKEKKERKEKEKEEVVEESKEKKKEKKEKEKEKKKKEKRLEEPKVELPGILDAPDAVFDETVLSAASELEVEGRVIKGARGPVHPIPKMQSIRLPALKAGESERLRHVFCRRRLMDRFHKDVSTLAESFLMTFDEHPKADFLGERPMDGSSGYTFCTYEDAYHRAVDYGSALARLGIGYQTRIGLYGPNCPDWTLVDIACQLYGITSVPLYDTLGEESIRHILGLCEIQVVISGLKQVEKLLALSDQLKHIVVLVPKGASGGAEELKEKAGKMGVALHFLDEFQKMGSEAKIAPTMPKPEDVFTICFTSGTTGLPKGVIQTHANLVASMAAAVNAGVLAPGETHISYLPLPHVFERLVQVAIIAVAGRIGYVRGGDARAYLMEDVVSLKPTVFVSVPRLFNRIYSGAMAKIEQLKGAKRKLFDKAYAAKLENLNEGIVSHPLYDRLVFKKIAAVLGGHVRVMVTGSAPLRAEVIQFLQICFSCVLAEGYGQTETTAITTVPLIGSALGGHVGPPGTNSEVKLVDVPEMGCFVTDKPLPRGEICVRGPACTQGYFRNPEQTAALIDADGWLHTGDVGRLNEDGTLTIIDRRKNIFKLSQGEYVAPEKVENVLAGNRYVAQAFVDGHPDEDFIVGIIVPDPDNILALAKELKVEGDLEAVCASPVVEKRLGEILRDWSAEQKLNGLETVRAVALTPEPFSVDNNVLTPTFKLRREIARPKFKADIDRMYSK